MVAKRAGYSGGSTWCGPVAQLGARFHGMEEVVGSNPTRSTNYFQSPKHSYKNRPRSSTLLFAHQMARVKNCSSPQTLDLERSAEDAGCTQFAPNRLWDLR